MSRPTCPCRAQMNSAGLHASEEDSGGGQRCKTEAEDNQVSH